MTFHMAKTVSAIQMSPLPLYCMPVSDKKIASLNLKSGNYQTEMCHIYSLPSATGIAYWQQ